MKILLYIAITAISFSATAGNDNSKNSTAAEKSCFHAAKDELENMLSGETPLNYERAVFVTENAYWENIVKYDIFRQVLDMHTEIIKRLATANNKVDEQNFQPWYTETVEQKKEKYKKLLNNWAIYTYISDTIYVDGFIQLPYNYSSDDPLGTINWEKSQVLNLLNKDERTGNCYALASLFKIFSERLNTDAKICTAPSHIWIKHRDQRGTSYNVELSAKAFPGLGKLETLTYTTDEATINNISMRTLDLKQSVAICLVQLAKGYEHKFKNRTDDFILQCAELALRHDSLNLNAMLLKAEVLEERIIQKKKTIAQLQTDKEFKEYQNLIVHLYKLGYREMPLDMKNIIIAEIMKEAYIITHRHIPDNDTSYVTLSKGIFEEMHEKKPKEKYFRTIFNTSTKKIEKFVPEDTLYNKYYFDPVAFAFSMDPLRPSLASISPYSAFNGNPILNIDPDGRDAVAIVDKVNKKVTIKAVYFVQTIPTLGIEKTSYSSDAVSQMQESISSQLNEAGYVVTEGGYAGYTVTFDLTFKEGGAGYEAEYLASKEEYKGVSIGNTFARGDETIYPNIFTPKKIEGGEKVKGGVTAENKRIVMNIPYDTKRNRIHEIFHTLFFDKDDAKKGIGSYSRGDMPIQEDINLLINNELLPKVETDE